MATAVALLWALSTTLEKYYIFDRFEPKEFVIIQGIILIIIGLILNSSKLGTNLNRLKDKCVEKPLVLLIPLVGIAGLLIFWYLIKYNEASLISSISTPMNLMFIVLISWVLFKEKMTYQKIVGIILALVSVYLLVKKSKS